VAVAAAAAMALFGGSRLWDEVVRLDGLLWRGRRWWAFLIGHLAAFAAFAAISAVLLEGDIRSLSHAGAWFLAWSASGLAALSCWGAAALPPRAWVPLARRGAGVLLIGVAVGALARAAGLLTTMLWPPLSRGTFAVVAGLLRTARLDVVCRPAEFVVGTPTFRVQIAPSCSGYEGIGLIWALLAAYFWIFRRELRFPRALMLVPVGTAVIWLANSVRIATLVIIGTYGSKAVAAGGFHSHAGWLAFNAVGLGLVVCSRRSRFFRTGIEVRESAAIPNPTAAYLAPMMALTAAMMVAGAFSAGFDWLYLLRVIAAGAVLWHYRRDYPDLRRTWSWSAAAIGVAVFALWMALEPPSRPGTAPLAAGLAGLPRGLAACWVVARVVGSVTVVPLAEELAFRGFSTRRLIAAEFTEVPPGRFSWPSFLISSALFGALHGRWLAGTLAGMLYAGALYRRGELADAVVAHATTNALIAAYVLTTGTWSLWS
jgi:exosortase E/protease (VPEID-CTERM system)